MQGNHEVRFEAPTNHLELFSEGQVTILKGTRCTQLISNQYVSLAHFCGDPAGYEEAGYSTEGPQFRTQFFESYGTWEEWAAGINTSVQSLKRRVANGEFRDPTFIRENATVMPYQKETEVFMKEILEKKDNPYWFEGTVCRKNLSSLIDKAEMNPLTFELQFLPLHMSMEELIQQKRVLVLELALLATWKEDIPVY